MFFAPSASPMASGPLRIAEAEHHRAVEILGRGDAHLRDVAADVDDVRDDALRDEAGRVVDHRDRHAVGGEQGMRRVAHVACRVTGVDHQRAALGEAEQRIDRHGARRIEAVLERRGASRPCPSGATKQTLGRRLARACAEVDEQLAAARARPRPVRASRSAAAARAASRMSRRRSVPAALRLAAEQARGDARLGEERGPVFRLLEVLLVHRLHHRVGDVEADEVHQAERADAEARGVDEDAVDGGEVGDAFREDAQRFRHEGAAGMVDDEARRVLAADRRRGRSACASAVSASVAHGSVSTPSTTSTIFITGTGLKKW